MPLYEYQCQKCGTVFETIVSLSNKKDITCTQCGSNQTRKLISAGISAAAGSAKNSGCKPRGGFT